MFATIGANWTLLLGIGIFMLGYGLLSTLLGVRANIEGFAPFVTGIIMAGYSLGFLVGALRTPYLVARVGHVRVFAALAAMASAAILLHALLVEPVTWFALRFITGFCTAGIYIVAESWLNGAASNTNRGSLLSIYLVVMSGSIALGQMLLNLDDPQTTVLFILASVLLSVATVPMLLSKITAPIIALPRSFGLRRLYQVSPLGFVGMFGTGMAQASLFTLGAVFASGIGLSLAAIATFMAMSALGGVFLQWPIGRLSDLFDRRQVIVVVSGLAALAMVLALLGLQGGGTLYLTALFFVYGGLCMPLYGLCVAHTNDFLDYDDMVSAGGTLAFVCGLGMVAGPLTASGAMQAVGSWGFVAFLLTVHVLTGAFGLYRMTCRSSVPLDRQGQYVYVSTPTPDASPVATAWAQERAAQQAQAKPEEQGAAKEPHDQVAA